MKPFLSLIFLTILVLATGCNNLSPRQDLKQQQQIDNQGGKINEIESMANSIKAEIAKLQNQADIQNSKLDKVQQGLANFQSANENYGVQILSGNGGLTIAIMMLMTTAVLAFLALHYRSESKKNEKTATILANQINDPELQEAVFRATLYTDVEDRMLRLFDAKSR